MDNSPSKTVATSSHADTFGGYLAGIFAWMFVGLSVSGVIGYMISISGDGIKTLFLNPIAFIIIVILQLGLVVLLSTRFTKLSPLAARVTFLAYSATIGITLSSIFLAYTSTSIMRVFFIAGGMFLVMALFGYLTKANLSKLGPLLLMGLVGIIIASLVNIFLGSNTLQLVVSYLGVAIFLGLTAYDVQKIKALYSQFGTAGNVAIFGALSLYLDFLNLFLFLLRIFGGSED